jgi:CRISPR-associated endonuclease/helicase Cas3
VDQVGSRLLFRGYGVSDSMKPVHAGLIGADCLILLDEAHLSEPFRQTLRWVQRYKSQDWRGTTEPAAPSAVALLSATPGVAEGGHFEVRDEDLADPTLKRRWTASKPARLVSLSKSKTVEVGERNRKENTSARAEEEQRVATLIAETLNGLKSLREAGIGQPAIAVVVNRVARARAVFEALRASPSSLEANLILMIGPARPVDRDELATALEPIRTVQSDRTPPRPMVIVSTQCIEAGVDIDLDGLITEAAPLDSLRQRFGRLNRAGRDGLNAFAAIIGGGMSDRDDPVYGEAIANTWSYLIEQSVGSETKKTPPRIDFGLQAFAKKMHKRPVPANALSPKPDAPVLLPAHLDLLSQTAPIPAADPEVSLYLHGPNRSADGVTVIWRADVIQDQHGDSARTRRLLLLMPPRTGEAIELPVWAVRRWLQGGDVSTLADVPIADPEDSRSRADREHRFVFRWAGDDERSVWIEPTEIRPGDTVIVPAHYGGVDRFGWNPNVKPATDVADDAARAFAERRFVLRVAPGLLGQSSDHSRLGPVIANVDSTDWKELRDALKRIALPESIRQGLDKLDTARTRQGRKTVEVYTDVYGFQNGFPLGIVFVAPFGLKAESPERVGQTGWTSTTEDDIAGSLSGVSLSLVAHSSDVARVVAEYARVAGFSDDRIGDLRIAAELHDSGKADPRFQAWLNYGDPLGPDPDNREEILAKSARTLPPRARAQSGLPQKWRHEALSVRLAPLVSRFADAHDQELVLWLIGTHHGYGRPFFPHSDPADARPRFDLPNGREIPQTLLAGPGPQSLAYDWKGSDWSALFNRVKARYGVWELARMEAILRLADHRASEQASQPRERPQ